MNEEQRIINLLRSAKMIPLNQILDLRISQYGRAVNSLRKKGYKIINHNLGMVNGKKHTAFELVYEPPSAGNTVKDTQITLGIMGNRHNDPA